MASGHIITRNELLKLYTERMLPVIVLLVAVLLRLYDLDTVPGSLTHDEAVNGIDAVRILEGERPIFLTDNFGREVLFIYVQAISVFFLGQTELALRLVSAFTGILTVAAAYPLAQRMFGSRVALLTCGWLSISLWHLIFSRVALRSISLPLFLTIGFYCLWRGLEGASQSMEARRASIPPIPNSPRPLVWFGLGGIVIGLSLYTYSVARFAPFFIVALALYIALLHRRLLGRTLPGLVLALALATLVFLPQGIFFLAHPESLVDRAKEVWVFNSELNEGNPRQALIDSTLRSLGMFAIRGDSYWDSLVSGRPIFDPLSAALLLIGVGLAVRRFREPAYGFIIIWLAVMFVPSLLVIQGTPSPIRATALIPAVFVLPALGTVWLWKAWDSHVSGHQRGIPAMLRMLPALIVTLVYLGGALYTYYSYFELWAKTPAFGSNFNVDRRVSFEVARQLVSTEQQPIFVAGGDYDDPWVQFTQFTPMRDPETRELKTFDYLRSVIFPANQAGASYLFASDLPHVLA